MEPQDIDNRDLILTLRRHASGEASPDEVADVLRDATLLLPTEKEERGPDEQAGMPGVEPSRRVIVLENERGETALPVFTHEGALREWAPEGIAYVGMRSRDAFAIALERNIAKVLVNPGSPEGIQIGGRGIRALAEAP